MGMGHSTSGRHGYNVKSPGDFIANIQFAQLIQMLEREDELRKSPLFQIEYKKAVTKHGTRGYAMVTDAIQLQVCTEFGFSFEEGSQVLQSASNFKGTSKQMSEINAVSLYRKYNRMQPGNLKVGDIAPVSGFSLFDVTSKEAVQLCPIDNATLVIAGSVT